MAKFDKKWRSERRSYHNWFSVQLRSLAEIRNESAVKARISRYQQSAHRSGLTLESTTGSGDRGLLWNLFACQHKQQRREFFDNNNIFESCILKNYPKWDHLIEIGDLRTFNASGEQRQQHGHQHQ